MKHILKINSISITYKLCVGIRKTFDLLVEILDLLYAKSFLTTLERVSGKSKKDGKWDVSTQVAASGSLIHAHLKCCETLEKLKHTFFILVIK